MRIKKNTFLKSLVPSTSSALLRQNAINKVPQECGCPHFRHKNFSHILLHRWPPVSWHQGNLDLLTRARRKEEISWVTLNHPVDRQLDPRKSFLFGVLGPYCLFPGLPNSRPRSRPGQTHSTRHIFMFIGGALGTISARTTAFFLAGRQGRILDLIMFAVSSFLMNICESGQDVQESEPVAAYPNPSACLTKSGCFPCGCTFART